MTGSPPGVIPQEVIWSLGVVNPHKPFLIILPIVLAYFRLEAVGLSTKGM